MVGLICKMAALGRAARRTASVAVGMGVTMCLGVSAVAGLSPVWASKDPTEPNQLAILNEVYGSGFSADGPDFVNGAIRAARIDDESGAEQQWSAGRYSARAVAGFTDYSQSFGITTGAGVFRPLFDVRGAGLDATGSGAVETPADEPVAFARGGEGLLFSSRPAANADARDHVISYALSGPTISEGAFLLFWEDGVGSHGDFDYNDLAVEVRPAPAGALLIPLPPAGWTVLAGLLCVGASATATRGRRLI